MDMPLFFAFGLALLFPIGLSVLFPIAWGIVAGLGERASDKDLLRRRLAFKNSTRILRNLEYSGQTRGFSYVQGILMAWAEVFTLTSLLAWKSGEWRPSGIIFQRGAFGLLDFWACLLPIRIASEDLGDYREAITRLVKQRRYLLASVLTLGALFWTGLNAFGYAWSLLRGRGRSPRRRGVDGGKPRRSSGRGLKAR